MQSNNKKILIAALAASILLTAPVNAEAVKSIAKKPKVLHVCKKTDSTVNILACNIYREARGESDSGMLAVGFVTLNRKDHEKFPSTVKKIVYQSGQFSWTKATGTFKVYEEEQWNKSLSFAKTLIKLHNNNKIVYDALDITKGGTYYHARKVRPYWTKVMVRTVKIDNHIFYKEKTVPQGA